MKLAFPREAETVCLKGFACVELGSSLKSTCGVKLCLYRLVGVSDCSVATVSAHGDNSFATMLQDFNTDACMPSLLTIGEQKLYQSLKSGGINMDILIGQGDGCCLSEQDEPSGKEAFLCIFIHDFRIINKEVKGFLLVVIGNGLLPQHAHTCTHTNTHTIDTFLGLCA